MSNNIRMPCFSFVRNLHDSTNNSMSSTSSSNPYSSMSSMSMSNNIRMPCFSLVRNLHDSTTIVTISSILDILNPTIRKSYLILSNNIPVLVTRPVLTEVYVILVIMHSIFKLKWVRLFMIISTMVDRCYNMASPMSSYKSTTKSNDMSSSNSPNTSRNCHSRSSYRHQERNRKLHDCCISTPSR